MFNHSKNIKQFSKYSAGWRKTTNGRGESTPFFKPDGKFFRPQNIQN